jgi:predicted amidohydrolase YtcJ
MAEADLILKNGNIITMTGEEDRAQAVAIKDGNIIAIGDNERVLQEQGSNTVVQDLDGKTLLPGFIDSHGHFANYIPIINGFWAYPAPLGNSNDIPTIQKNLKEFFSQPGLDKDKVHIGMGYDDAELVEQRHPNRYDLDPVTGDFKFCMAHVSGHFLSCNTAGMQVLGYEEDAPNPSGGVIRRGEQGEMIGVFEESAMYPILKHLTLSSVEEAVVNTQAAQDMYLSYGVTTAQEGLATVGILKLLKQMSDADVLKIDVPSFVKWTEFEDAMELFPTEYEGTFKLAGMKITGDGSPQGKTAYLSTPYFEVPHSHAYHYHGYPIMPQEEMNERVSTAFKHNMPVITHANGDAAMDMLITALEYALEEHGDRDHRTTIIHGQTMRLDQVQRMANLDMVASYFAAHTFFWGDWHEQSVLGPWRARNISPTGWAKDFGLDYTIHMDAPVVYPDMMKNLWTAVNRVTRTGKTLGENHKITPYEGLEALTVTAAYQAFEEDSKGSLEVGKRADMVILDNDPMSVDPMLIKDISVLETFKDGESLYRKL